MISEIVFEGMLWEHEGEAPWTFVTLPADFVEVIRSRSVTSGFGSVKVRVTIGDTEWKTSLFPDKESGSYLLPVKREVRSRESLSSGDTVSVRLIIE